MSWLDDGNPRTLADDPILAQYQRSQHHHEGAHEIQTWWGFRVWVGPDGVTTARGRLGAVTAALGRRGDWEPNRDDTEALIVGALVLHGATNITINDDPLFPTPEPRGQWNVELKDDGEVTATWMG